MPLAKTQASKDAKNNPHAAKPLSMEAPGKIEPKKRLTIPQRQLWDAVVATFPESRLGEIDSFALQELVDAYKLMQKAKKAWSKDITDNKARLAFNTAFQVFRELGTRFGIDPRSRAFFDVTSANDDAPQHTDDVISKLGVFG